MSRMTQRRRIIENASSPSASLDVLGRIRSDILDGRLLPGQKLRFADLRKDYGGSVGTLREALSHLLSEEFVSLDTGRGFRVAPVSADDLLDLAEFCVDFETRALRDSILHGDDAWEVRVLTAFHRLAKIEKLPLPQLLERQGEWRQLDRDFHEACATACRSNWLLHFRRTVFDQAERYRMLALRHNPNASDRRSEHSHIYEAVLARDAEMASKLMEQHVRRTVDDVLQYAPELQGRAALGIATA